MSHDKLQALVGITDLDGVLRGKLVSEAKFESLLRDGGGFCDCILGWDVDDQLYDKGQFTGWHTGFPDAHYRLVEKPRYLGSDKMPFLLAELRTADDDEHALCPRSLLRRVCDRLAEKGILVESGFEYEFFLFKETPQEVRDKNFRNLEPFSPGNFGYSVLRLAQMPDDFRTFFEFCRNFDVPLEGLHCETGPGVWEAALEKSDALESADRAELFKTFGKGFLHQRGISATFMAKWSMDYPGQSGHYHFSLRDTEGRYLLHDLPDMLNHSIGGLQHCLPEWLPMLAPTVNSFTRLVKGAWAPTSATWGTENRTAALRVVPGSEEKLHIENRIPGADANPYLVAAATLAAILVGIEYKLNSTLEIQGNAYEQGESLPSNMQFAPSLRNAAEKFATSARAREIFGDDFVDHFVMTRLWESEQAERHVTDWQLRRYFEII